MSSDRTQHDRKFLSRILSQANPLEYQGSTQVHILREELYLGVMPIGGRSRKYTDFIADVIGEERDIALQVLSQLERANQRNATECICDVVNSVAQSLAYSGSDRYEISLKNGCYSLDYIPDTCFYDFGLLGAQVVPKPQREHVKKILIIGSAKRIWKISLPKSIHTRRQYLKLLNNLFERTNILPKQLLPDDIFSTSSVFDSSYYNKESKKYIFRQLNKIGGVQRDHTLEHVTGYFSINRTIRLNLSKAVIREHIISELNKLFKRLKLEAHIKVSGLPTSQDIGKTLDDLKKGLVGINEALEQSNVY